MCASKKVQTSEQQNLFIVKRDSFAVITNDPLDEQRVQKAIQQNKNEIDWQQSHVDQNHDQSFARYKYWQIQKLCDSNQAQNLFRELPKKSVHSLEKKKQTTHKNFIALTKQIHEEQLEKLIVDPALVKDLYISEHGSDSEQSSLKKVMLNLSCSNKQSPEQVQESESQNLQVLNNSYQDLNSFEEIKEEIKSYQEQEYPKSQRLIASQSRQVTIKKLEKVSSNSLQNFNSGCNILFKNEIINQNSNNINELITPKSCQYIDKDFDGSFSSHSNSSGRLGSQKGLQKSDDYQNQSSIKSQESIESIHQRAEIQQPQQNNLVLEKHVGDNYPNTSQSSLEEDYDEMDDLLVTQEPQIEKKIISYYKCISEIDFSVSRNIMQMQ